MKKVLSIALFALAALPWAATPAQTQPAPAQVDVVSIVEHPALDAIRDGLHQGLREAGYEDGKNLTWRFQSAQGSTTTAAQIARQFVGDQANVVVAIATPAAQAAVAATKTVPIVFSGITDPVAAKLVPGWGASGTNVTGVSNRMPLAPQIALIREVLPHARRVGMVYNPGEANSVAIVNAMKAALPQDGMTLVTAAAPRTLDVADAALSLVSKVDMIYTGTDNNVVSAYESLVKVAREAHIPLIASDVDSVTRGAAAALGIDYRAMGAQTARMVERILKGTAPGAIPVETSDRYLLYVNPTAAKQQGFTLPQDVIAKADKVVR